MDGFFDWFMIGYTAFCAVLIGALTILFMWAGTQCIRGFGGRSSRWAITWGGLLACFLLGLWGAFLGYVGNFVYMMSTNNFDGSLFTGLPVGAAVLSVMEAIVVACSARSIVATVRRQRDLALAVVAFARRAFAEALASTKGVITAEHLKAFDADSDDMELLKQLRDHTSDIGHVIAISSESNEVVISDADLEGYAQKMQQLYGRW